MSTTVDNRVVEMRFDNAQFERNVATSMSTLDKLKQSLHLTGAAKGLDNINAAAKNNNLNYLGSAAETVGLKFNAMYTMADQALRNITTRAMQTGERMVKALTLDPITTGFQEYETQINAVQTILANTSSKGTTIDDVNKALEELNTYADKTIYNFTEMTRNIGTFTAAGVDLDTSVSAIQGIANLAAVSGSTSQQASTAMYQLSQALATGTVKLMDWNSVVNAGMGGQVFQDALIRTAAVMAGASGDVEAWRQENIEAYGSFRDSLTSSGWLTTDVLTATLEQFTMAAEEGSKEWEAYKKSLMETGYTEKQANEILKMANTATDAATKVKTFTQLWDVLKESAQSGWSQTWKLIIGDFEEAKGILTPFADFLTNIINGVSEARNKVLEIALDSPFAKIIEKVQDVTKATEKVAEATKNYGEILDKVIGGAYGNGQARWDKLAEEGYNWAKVQNMVNEKLGSAVRHNEELVKSQEKTNTTQATTIEQLAEMSDAQLEEIGFTKEQIKSLRDLQDAAKRAGYSLSEVIENPDLLGGRNLLIDGFKNLGKAIIEVVKTCKSAWQDIFPPKTIEERAKSLYNLIAGFRKFSEGLIMSEETAGYLKRTLKGLFAAIDIVLTVLGGPLKWAFDGIVQLLGKFDVNILEHTAKIGDAIVKLRDWIDEHNIFVKGIELVLPYLKKFGEAIKDWFNGLKEVDNIPKYIIDGLVWGIKEGIPLAIQAIIDLGKSIIESFCGTIESHSPSKVFIAIGGFIIAGLIIGLSDGMQDVVKTVIEVAQRIISTMLGALKEGGGVILSGLGTLWTTVIDWVKSIFTDSTLLTTIGDKIQGIVNKIAEFFKKIGLGPVIAAILGSGIFLLVKKLFDFFSMFQAPLEGFGEMLENIGEGAKNALNGLAKSFKASAFEKRMKGIYSLAKAIALLAVSMVLIASLDAGELKQALISIGILALIMGALAVVANRSGIVSDFSFAKLATAMAGVGMALILMAASMKILGSIKESDVEKVWKTFGIMIGGLATVVIASATIVHGKTADSIKQVGKILKSMAVAMLLMTIVAKIIAGMTWDDFGKAAVGMLGLVGIIGLLMLISSMKDIKEVGNTLLKISAAMAIMVIVGKLISNMTWEDMGKAAVGILGLVGIIALLTLITKISGKEVNSIGNTLLKISGAILVLGVAAKVIAGMSWGDMGKAAVGLAGLAVIIAMLITITKLAGGKDAPKIGMTLLAMSVAIGILAFIAVLLGMVPVENLTKGVTAVSILALMMSAMVAATKGANKCVGNLVVMTIAITLLVAAVALLSSDMIDPERLKTSVASIAILMGMFALIEYASKSVSNKTIGTLLIMTLVVAALGAIVWGLSYVDATNALPNAAAVSLLMIALAAAFRIVNDSRDVANGAWKSMLAMGLVLVEIAAIFGLMQLLDIQPSLETAAALSLVLIAMSAALGILATIGPAAQLAVPATGALIKVMTAIGAFLAAAGLVMALIPEDIYNAMIGGLDRLGNLFIKLGEIIGGVIGGMVQGFVDTAGPAMEQMGTHLSKFMKNAGGFLTGLDSIDTDAISAAKMLAEMILIITAADLLQGITSFFGLGSGTISGFGAQLIPFGEALTQFSSTVAGKVNEEAVKAAANAGLIMVEFAREIPNSGGVLGFIMGNNDMADFGVQLLLFGSAITGFSNIVSQNPINEAAVQSAATAGLIMVELAKEIPNTGGILSFIMGDNDLATFGSQLLLFGVAITGFSNIVSQNPINEAAVQAAATAGLIMVELAKEIPNTGGLLAFIMGDNDLATFGTQLLLFGAAICGFSKVLTDNPINESAITAAANAGSIMVALAKDVPTSGGLLGMITGNQGLGKFGDNIKEFGKGIAGFSKEVSGMDTSGVSNAISAAKKLIDLDDTIADGAYNVQVGNPDLVDLAQVATKFGKEMAEFGKKVAGTDFSKVSSAVTNATSIKNLCDSTKGLDSSGIDKLKSAIEKLAGTKISDFTSTFSESFSPYTTRVSQLTSMISKLAGLDTSGVAGFKTAINTLGQTGVSDFIKAFSDADASLVKTGADMIAAVISGIKSKAGMLKTDATVIISDIVKALDAKKGEFKTLGENLMSQLVSGISSKSSSIKTAATTGISAAITAVRGYYGSDGSGFYGAGGHLVQGFAAGISANTWRAEAKARAMAKAALAAAEEALGIASPSKEFYAVGDFAGQGFVNALGDYARTSYIAGSDMADSARKGLNAAIGKIRDLINGDMDMTPTIRPVLDLSGVESGVGAIDGMFNSAHSIGTMANLRAISAMSGQNGQNGMDDVVSAINKLGKNLGNVRGDTYNVHGITYDDGSNVANAIQTLVRAAVVERRA